MPRRPAVLEIFSSRCKQPTGGTERVRNFEFENKEKLTTIAKPFFIGGSVDHSLRNAGIDNIKYIYRYIYI